MADTVFNSVHRFLLEIPYPGLSWNEVITTNPSLYHLSWSFLFVIASGILQIFCWILAKIFAAKCVPHSSTPKLPNKMKIAPENYKMLIESNNVEILSDINKYSDKDLSEISIKYCDNKLNASETRQYLTLCNKHYMEYRKNGKKIADCLFPLFSKLIGFTFGVFAFYDKDWIYNSSLFWTGLPNEPYKQNLNYIPNIKLLYIGNIGWYIYKLFATVCIDRRLNDFIASMIHHSATLCLLTGSYYFGFVRIGVTIVLLHDPADIVLQTGKLCRLCKRYIMTNIAFGLLVIVWFCTRIVIFPYHCIFSTFIFVNETHCISAGALAIFAVILYVLHLHWFQLIIFAVVKAIKGEKVADPRDKSDLDEYAGKNASRQ